MKFGRRLEGPAPSETKGPLSLELHPTSSKNACSSLPQNVGAALLESLQGQNSRSDIKTLSILNCVIARFVKLDLSLSLAFAFLRVDLLK